MKSTMKNSIPYAINIQDVTKQYRLGQIGGGTLRGDLSSWWAKKRGKTDPNSKIGYIRNDTNETFNALSKINLIIQPGEAVGIIGRNGAGKSTLLKLLSRVTAPTEGVIDIYGRISSMLEVGTGFNGEMTGRENIYMNGAILGMSKAEIDAKMEDIIEFSEVREFIDTPVKRYSSGMYVKLAFSVAAHLDSEILIMDEVLAVGDMAFQKKCLEKMKDAASGQGRTVLYVSHNMSTIRKLCSRCIVLEQGKIIFDGDTEIAIELYIDQKSELQSYREYTIYDYKVPNNTAFQFLSTQLSRNNCEYEAGETLDVRLKCKSTIDIKNLYLKLQIVATDGTRVGSSFPKCGINMVKNTTTELNIKMPTFELGTGIYMAEICAYEYYDNGLENYINTIKNGFYFEIVPSGSDPQSFRWYPATWGRVHLADLEISLNDGNEWRRS